MRLHVLAFAVAAALANTAYGIDRVEANANLSDGITTDISGITSVRDWKVTSSLISSGDTYGAALIGQTTTTAAFVTNATGRVTSFVFDEAPSQHGTLAGSNAVVNMTESQTQIDANTYRIVVDVSTADSSSLWVGGLVIAGLPITQGRFDVGAGSSADGLLWDELPPIQSVTITNALLADGAVLATSTALINGRTLPNMGAVVVWNGVVGSPVDESQMIFTVTVPEPASLAMCSLAGVTFIRRRRA